MAWGAVELEPEVTDWLERLSDEEFGRVEFYVDLLAERGPLLEYPTRANSEASSASSVSTSAHGVTRSASHTTSRAGGGSFSSRSSRSRRGASEVRSIALSKR